MTTDPSGVPGKSLFVSYAGPDRAWAEWVAWQLEQAGYAVELDTWDWAAGDNTVLRMNQALEQADRVVALYSEAYFEHQRFTTDEWTAVMAGRDRRGRLVPLRLGDVTLPSLLRPLLAPSLSGLAADDARRVLLEAVGGPVRPHEAPAFPGAPQPPPAVPTGTEPRLPGERQPTVWEVPVRNAAFTGRDRDIVLVRQSLLTGQPVVVRSELPFGGVGKTQVATEYAHRFAAQYDLVGWVNAEDPKLVLAQLTALAAGLGLVGEHGDDAALPALRTHLQQRRRWLLIFDNAEAVDAVQPWLPAGVGHVLITSRSGNWQEFATSVVLELFTRRESVAMLQGRVPDLSGPDADRVADTLGDLPLALVQAATVLSGGMPAGLYLDLLDTAAADEMLSQGLPPSYPRRLAAALRMSINGLAQDDEALQLLRLCCALAPEPIPMALLAAAPEAVPAPLSMVLASPLRLYQAASCLGELARVAQRGVQIHRLVKILVRTELDAGHLGELHAHATALVAAGSPGDPASTLTWPEWSQLMPHLLALGPGANDNPALRDVASDALLYLRFSGNSAVAFDLAKSLYDQWHQKLGADDPHTLTAAAELARAYHNLGRGREALDLAEDTLTRRRATLGPDDPATLRSSNARGLVLQMLGKVTEARHQAEETLARQIVVLGPDHSDTLTTRGNIAGWRGEAGGHAAAVQGFEQLLVDQLRVLGPDHLDTLTVRGNIAGWRGEAGGHAAAIRSYEQLLADRLRVLGPDHPHTLTTRGNIAGWRGKAGDHAAAVQGFEQLLVDRLRVLGPDHPDTLAARANIAFWRGEAGDHAAAIRGFEQLLVDQLRVLGPDHPDTLAARSNIAFWRGEAGDHAAAIRGVEQLLADQLRVLGPDHPDTLNTRGNIAGWRGRAGDRAAAIQGYEQLLADQLRVLGPDHPRTLVTRGNLAALFLERNAIIPARTQAMARLEAERRLFGANDPRTQRSQRLVNEIKARMGGRTSTTRTKEKKRKKA